MKYLLDTNICIYIIRKKPERTIKRLNEVSDGDAGISSVTLSELMYGVEKSSDPERNRVALLEFLTFFDIYDYDAGAATEYGVIRADLEKRGRPIGGMDILIAAHAKFLDLILVTNNESEFVRVHGLKVENWAKG